MACEKMFRPGEKIFRADEQMFRTCEQMSGATGKIPGTGKKLGAIPSAREQARESLLVDAVQGFFGEKCPLVCMSIRNLDPFSCSVILRIVFSDGIFSNGAKIKSVMKKINA
jgi:hypothetical protein